MQGSNSNIENLRSQLVSVNENEINKVSPRESLMKYVSYYPWFFISLLIFFSAAFLYIRYKIPVFNNSIEILVKDDSKKSGDDLSTEILSQLVLNGKTNLANEVEIVKSRTILEKVVRNLGINTIYYSEGNVRESELYDTAKNRFIIFTYIKDSTQNYKADIKVKDNKIFFITSTGEKQIQNGTMVYTPDFTFYVFIKNFSLYKPTYTYRASWFPPSLIAEYFYENISADPLNKDASILDLSLQSTLPRKARDILNNIALEYKNANIQDKNETLDNTIQFVDSRILLIQGQLGGVENRLKDFRQDNILVDSAQQQLSMDRTKDILDQMDQLQVKLKVTEMVGDYVNDPSRKFSLVPSTLGIEDVTLLDLIKTYNDAAMQREELLKTLPEGNISVSTIEDQLTALQPKIVENVNNIKQSYASAYNIAKGKYDAIMQTLGTIPGKQKDLLEIERQQGIKEKLYLYLLQKKEESEINKASAVGNSVPIDPAVTDRFPVAPKPALLLALAGLLGILVPFLIIYLQEFLNDRIFSRDDITKLSKIPIGGEISHLKDSTIFIDFQSRSVLPEQFRIIRTNLQYFSLKEDNAVIMVTSTMENEGKTFVSMNFGATLSLSGKKVLIVEFDLRKPKISKSLGLENKTGITSYLATGANLEKSIVPIEGFTNYFLLPSGPIAPNPAELLLNPKLDEMFAQLKKQYDYIVLDCPPIGMVSDPKVIAKYADMSFYIVRQRYTFKKQIGFINELYQNEVFKNMLLVINDIKVEGNKRYYSSYGYTYSAYNYNYGYGTAKDNRSKNILNKIFKRKD